MKKRLLFLGFFITHCCLLSFSQTTQWYQTRGAYGGQIRTIFDGGPYIFSGGYSGVISSSTGYLGGGVFRSSDNGSVWSASNSGLDDPNIYCFLSYNNKLFCGTGRGVFVSTDNGQSWVASRNGLPAAKEVWALAVNGNTMFAGLNFSGGTGSIYKSTDEGQTWSQAGNVPQKIYSFFIDGSDIYANTDGSKYYKSTDNGNIWTQGSSMSGVSTVYNMIKKDNTYWAATNLGLYKSTDSANTWIKNTAFPSVAVPICFLMNGSRLYVGTTSGMVYTNDDGTTWNYANQGYGKTILSAILKNSHLIAATMDGIYQTDANNIGWQKSSNGAPGTVVNDMKPFNNGILCATNSGLQFTNDFGVTWQQVYDKNGDALVVKGQTIIMGVGNSNYYSKDGGNTWSLPVNFPSTHKIRAYASSDSFFFAATAYGIYRSGFDSILWQQSNSGLTNTNVWSLLVYEKTGGGFEIFAGTSDGVFVSSNNGSSWVAASTGLHIGADVYDLDNMGHKIFAATDQGIYFTDNMGNNWVKATTSSGSTVNSHRLMITENKIYYANLADAYGASTGIYESSDSGITWIEANNGLLNLYGSTSGNTLVPKVMSMLYYNGNKYIGTNGMGVWIDSVLTYTGIKEAHKPQENNYIWVYPNPSFGKFTISTSLSESIELYDMTGKMLDKFFVNANETFVYRHDLAQGCYLLRGMQTGAQKKLIVK